MINPELGHNLAGYGGDNQNTGVHDDLTVTAMCLTSEGDVAILLALDIIGLPARLNAQIRQAVSAATDVPAEQVFCSCTHVHSGPEVRHIYYSYGPVSTVRAEYDQRLAVWAAEAAAEAKADCEPVTLRYNFATAALNMNRRYNFPDRKAVYIPGYKQLAGTSDQFVDRELGIVAFGKVHAPNRYKAILTNYTCHPLCVGNSSPKVTADYQGVPRRTVEQTYEGAMCLTTTDAVGYIPSRNQHFWGGHEIRTGALAAGAGELLVDRVLETAGELVDAQPLALPPVA